MDDQVYVPKRVTFLQPMIVRTNGQPDQCQCRVIGEDGWKIKPVAVLAYYRPATEAELAELLPQAA